MSVSGTIKVCPGPSCVPGPVPFGERLSYISLLYSAAAFFAGRWDVSGVLKPWHVSYEAVRQQSKAVALHQDDFLCAAAQNHRMYRYGPFSAGEKGPLLFDGKFANLVYGHDRPSGYKKRGMRICFRLRI